jgi:hypothetical protein
VESDEFCPSGRNRNRGKLWFASIIYDIGGEMKRLFFILIAVALISGCSQEAEAGEKSCDSGWWSKVANECVTHPSPKERRNEVGVGADVILHEGEEGEVLNQVHAEYRYDWQNGEHKAYAVATTKLSDIWAKVKSLFKKEE